MPLSDIRSNREGERLEAFSGDQIGAGVLLSATGHAGLTQLSCIPICPSFVRLAAQRMCELVGDGKWQKRVERHPESFEKRSASERVRIEQRFLKKRLSGGQNRKGWTIRVPTDLAENRFPIR